jgi:serine/threonine protein kinase
MRLERGVRVGAYELLQRLGQGGMATSWLARGADGATVVLKFPDTGQLGDPAVYERFRREVAIGAAVDHPAIPKALGIGEDWHHPYLVMEFVEGELLSSVLQREGRLPWPRASELLLQLLDALEYLHARGIYHRDLKPENLVLTPEGRLKILDFGLALVGGRPRVTWRGFSGLAGTPEYMAPEQIRGERGGARSDVYAAGVILYEMLRGRPPFSGDNPLAVMHQALHDVPAPISRFADVPTGADAVLARALHRDRTQRFPSAQAFAAALRHPDAVVPPPAPPRRRGLPAWAAQPLLWFGLLVVLTALGTLALVWHFRHGG